MWSKNDLVDVVFEGYFQVNEEWRDQARDHRNKLKEESPEDVARYDAVHPGMSDTEDAINHRQIDFWMKILEYNSNSGLFIAQGRDYFGESGLVGDIIENNIAFTKRYGGKVPQGGENRFWRVEYEGSIFKSNGSIVMEGKYTPPEGITSKLGGEWKLLDHSKGQDL